MDTIKVIVIVIFLIVGLFGSHGVSHAQVMTGTTYNIEIDSINVGGGRGTSANYALESTQGETATGKTTAAANNLYAGFQLPIVGVTLTPTPGPGVSNAGTGVAVKGILANVEKFIATGLDRQVQLQWQNPDDADFAGVRIMRSEEFYPVDPSAGQLVYDGLAQDFLDTRLNNGTQYYYTAFAYDTEGNFSSGAVTTAIPQAPGIPPVAPVPTPPLVPPEQIPEIIKDLSLADFDFIQEGVKLPVIRGRVEVKPDFPLTISIDYDKLPEALKTILTTMRNGKEEVFSFLLRVDDDKERYLATMNPPMSGLYPVSFTVVDFKNQGLQKVEGEIRVKEGVGGTGFPLSGEEVGRFWAALLIFLLLALLLFVVVKYVYRKLSERDDVEFQ